MISFGNYLPGFQEILGRTMHVATLSGHQPTGMHVAVIHGLAANAGTWLPLVRHLAADIRDVLLMDIPGHGFSTDPEPPYSCLDAYAYVEEALCRNLKPGQRNLLVGNSLGGAFTIRFAMDHPDLVSHCVLISPAGAPFPESARSVVEFFLADSTAQALRIVDRVWSKPDFKSCLLVPFVLHATSRPAFRSLVQSIIDIDDHPDGALSRILFTPEQIAHFPPKTLLIWGGRDHVLPRSMRDFFCENLPDSSECLFPPEFGHCPQMEVPGTVASIIRDWMQRV